MLTLAFDTPRPYRGAGLWAAGKISTVLIERLFIEKLDIDFRTAVMLSFRGLPSRRNARPNELLKRRALMSQPS